MLPLLLLLLAAPAWAADPAPDPANLIQLAVAAMEKSWQEARLYSYKETRITRTTSNRLPFRQQSMTYEIKPMDGKPHATLIERDGYRLTAAERREHEEEMKRQREEMKQRLRTMGTPDSQPTTQAPLAQLLPFDQLSKSYDLKIVDEDPTRWYIEGRLKRKPLPPTNAEKYLRVVQFLLVIDRAESQFVRMEIKQRFRGKPQMSMVIEREKVLDSVWMTTHFRHNMQQSFFFGAAQLSGQMDNTSFDFRKP